MSLQPHSGAEIPPLTARVARAANPKGTTAMWIRDRLDGLWSDLEKAARDAPEVLDELVTAEWARRYGRPVRLCSQPSHPVARLEQVGNDARELLGRLDARFPDGAPAQANVLRTILVQHFLVDAKGRFRQRTKRDCQPPSRIQIESPYETEARFTRRGGTRWTGFLVHVTETCDDKRINIITDVATAVSSEDSQALPGIHARLRRRRLLPDRHLVDGGYTSVAGMDEAARLHRVTLIGLLPPSTTPQHRAGDGFGRENFIIDFDQGEVTCPKGQVSGNWQDMPVAEPTKVTVRFDARQCGRWPERAKCTPGPFRSLYFPTRRLHVLQTKNRADQQDANCRRLYGRRSGAEGTIMEFADGHRGRWCRYRGLAKTHVQHVLTVLAVNVERLSLRGPADSSCRPRPPTAFQQYLDTRDLPRPLWWRQGK